MTDYSINIDKKRIVRHIVFWLCWICGFTFIQSFGFGIHDFRAWLFYYLVTIPLFVVHTYIIAYWLVPSYYLNRRYWLFSSWIVALLLVFSVFELIISNELVWRMVKPENIQRGNYLTLSNILINGIGNEYIIIVFFSIKVVRFWNSKMGEKSDLLNKKIKTEMELLKYQSYPRFVLNVADKLESMAQQQSAQTPEMIIRLSNLMNSMASGNRSDKTLLQKEIELIRSYIEIQRMSFPVGYDVKFMVSGELNGIRIPHFLFFQMVEEGFALLGDFKGKSDYSIFIKAEPHYLLFSMTLWNNQSLCRRLNPEVIENCRKSLAYFYPENHKVISNFEINFVEVSIELYKL